MKKSFPIPLYKLRERGKTLLEVRKLEPAQSPISLHPAHRDDNYVLIYQQCGVTKVMVDFKEIIIKGAAIFCILPGQVHYGISTENTIAWIIAVDPAWINDSFRTVLIKDTSRNTSVPIDTEGSELLKDCIQLLQRVDSQKNGNFDDKTKRAMLDVCLSLFVTGYQNEIGSISSPNLRIAVITQQFRNLLMISYRTMKGPSEYASSLNISPSYLNEAVKESSGHPVSYWIHQEIIMEAKRMLYYSDDTVKEIAYNLGYSDPAYFIRLFTKIAGLPPMQFRKKYRW